MVGIFLLAVFLVLLYISESPGGRGAAGRRRRCVTGRLLWLKAPHPFFLSSREGAQETKGEGRSPQGQNFGKKDFVACGAGKPVLGLSLQPVGWQPGFLCPRLCHLQS